VGTKMHRNVPRRELSLLRGTGATIFITFVNYGNTIWSKSQERVGTALSCR